MVNNQLEKVRKESKPEEEGCLAVDWRTSSKSSESKRFPEAICVFFGLPTDSKHAATILMSILILS